jgi:phytoene desaturase
MAAALRLRAKGYAVTLVDRCSRLGGRAQVFEQNGYKHDAGPTVITAPFLFDELFTLFDKNLSSYIDFLAVEPWYRFHFADGNTLDYGGSIDQTVAEIARLSPQDAGSYKKLLSHSKKIFDVGFTQLSDKPFHSIWTMIKQIPALVRLGCYRTVFQMVKRYFKDERLQQAFTIHPLLVGGNPYETTSIYSLIHYLERRWGVFFAKGGTGAIVDGLEQLMHEEGILIRMNTTVTHINVIKQTVNGVELENGEHLDADLVVSNADPLHLYNHLLPRDYQHFSARFKTKKVQTSMGLFVLYFGSTKQFPEVAHHTIWLGKRHKELLTEIFHGQQLPEDFSLYVHRPTATDCSFAPEGCDSFYVLAPVPNLRADIDWNTAGSDLQARIIEALDKSMLPGIKQHVTSDFYMTPADFKQDYLSVDGAGFSVSPLFRQSAWFRFHNRAEGPKNLYLVGAGTHPGAGVPGVLSSAKVVDQLIPDAIPVTKDNKSEHNGVFA